MKARRAPKQRERFTAAQKAWIAKARAAPAAQAAAKQTAREIVEQLQAHSREAK